MLRYFFSFALSFAIVTICFSQPVFTLDSALARCNTDTIGMIRYLEKFLDYNIENAAPAIANHLLGKLYTETRQYDKAYFHLHKAMEFDPRYLKVDTAQDNCGIIGRYSFSARKADICVSLSTLHRRQGDLKNALHYLELADSTYMPYRSCANGIFMYQAYLSFYFADIYLEMGDTIMAVNCFLTRFQRLEGYDQDVAKRLREILLLTHTQKEINAEVNKAIASLRRSRQYEDGYRSRVYKFTLFGVDQFYDYGNLRTNRKLLKNDYRLKILKGAPVTRTRL